MTLPRVKRLKTAIESLQPPQWLIDGIIEQKTLTALIGKPGSFKTFIALDMALCIAHGINWHGRKTEKRPVVYCCGEGVSGFYRRAAGWLIAHREEIDADGDPDLYILDTTIALNEVTEAESLVEEIKKVVTKDTTPGLIVIDTLIRYGSRVAENDNSEMSEYINTITSHLAKPFDSSVLLIHHTAKGGSSTEGRGASSLGGALDTQWSLDDKNKINNSITLTNTKMKDHDEGMALTFEMKPIDVPESQAGTLYPVLAAETKEAPVDSPAEVLLGKSGKDLKVRQRLYRFLIDHYDNDRSFDNLTSAGIGKEIASSNVTRDWRSLQTALSNKIPQATSLATRSLADFLSAFVGLASIDGALPRPQTTNDAIVAF